MSVTIEILSREEIQQREPVKPGKGLEIPTYQVADGVFVVHIDLSAPSSEDYFEPSTQVDYLYPQKTD